MTCFLHIPRTAGTTIRKLLADAFPENRTYFYYPPSQVSRHVDKADPGTELLIGHWYFGFHKDFGAAKKLMFTFLRDPIKRVVSQFFFSKRLASKRGRKHPLAKHLKPGLELCEVIEQSKLRFFENMMVRQIAGIGEDLPQRLFGEVTKKDLEVAKQNLDGFEFVGIQEHADKDIPRLCELLAVDPPEEVRKENPGHYPTAESWQQSLPYLEALNQHDIALYQYALDRRRAGAWPLCPPLAPA
jgi:hypothetical protein